MSADIMSEERLQATKNLTAIVYALQAVGFLLGITWVVAIIVNYVKKEDVKGTWLESHFRWQIRQPAKDFDLVDVMIINKERDRPINPEVTDHHRKNARTRYDQATAQ